MFDLARTVQLVRGALFEAEPTWRGYLAEAGDWKKTALLLTVPLIVAAAIVAYVLAVLGSGVSVLGLRPTFSGLLLMIVWGAVAAAVVAFIFSAFASVFGGKGSFALGLAATTLAFVPGYVGQALSGLPWLGWLIGLGLAIYSLVQLWRIIPLYLEVPDGKRTAHYIVSLLATIVAFLVLSSLLGRSMMGSGQMLGGMQGMSGAGMEGAPMDASGSGLFGGIVRQGDLIGAAEQDRYTPPENGQLTERQVQEFIRVMERLGEASTARAARIQEIAERADANQQVSLQDFGAVMSGMTEIAGLSTAEIEIVKSAGGNWAEHQWV